jgi:sensor histidine kinase regulating citrate/malate metabolism
VSSGSHDQIAVLNQREVIVNRVAIEVEPGVESGWVYSFRDKNDINTLSSQPVRSSAMRITCALCATNTELDRHAGRVVADETL